MLRGLPTPSINLLIREGDADALREALSNMSPIEIAELISSKSEEEQSFIFGVLPQAKTLPTFEFLPAPIQRRILHLLPTGQGASLLKELSPDDRTNFLQELPREVIDAYVKLLPTDERILTLTLLGYPEGSIGRLMTPDYLAVENDWTIEKVLDHIQNYGHDSETINIIYVVDADEKLLYNIKLKDLLFVPRQSKVKDIADKQYVALSVNDSEEESISIFKQYDEIALPVVDENRVLLGIVTIDDVLRLSDQEATKDMQEIGGMEALTEPYMQTPFFDLVQKRGGWLIVLFIGEMFTATAMGYFEKEIEKAVVLALFLPLIISSGGNAGSQASTLVIRALALGEVRLRDWWKIVRREVLAGVCLGAILGTIGFFRVTLWTLFSNIYGEFWFLIALTIGFALIGVVLWGTLVGALLPLILMRLGADPAKSSAPFVATIVDVTGLVIYFLIAISILKGTVL